MEGEYFVFTDDVVDMVREYGVSFIFLLHSIPFRLARDVVMSLFSRGLLFCFVFPWCLVVRDTRFVHCGRGHCSSREMEGFVFCEVVMLARLVPLTVRVV